MRKRSKSCGWRSEGVGTASGCLPALLQIPIFVGLYHLLAALAGLGGSAGAGVFGPVEVSSFAHALV